EIGIGMSTLRRTLWWFLCRAASAAQRLPRAIFSLDERERIAHTHTGARREMDVAGDAIGQIAILDEHARLPQRVKGATPCACHPSPRAFCLGGHERWRREKRQGYLTRVVVAHHTA